MGQAQQNEARGRGRPRVPVLDKAGITAAAMAELRRGGLRGLTMRSLAARLGVSPGALYNHAASRDAVLAWVQEQVSDELHVSAFGTTSLRDALAQWAWSYLRYLRTRPELVELIVAVPVAHTARTSRMYQTIVDAFRAAGWYDRSVLPSLSALETFIFGAALDSAGPENVYQPAPREPAPRERTPRDAAGTGRTAGEGSLGDTQAAFAELVLEAGASERDLVFQLGLDALLTGLQMRWGAAR